MNKKAIIFVVVPIMVFSFCIAPPAHAIVPAVAWAVWAIATGATGVAVAVDETRSDQQQAKANSRGQDVSDLGTNQLSHPIEYYQLGSPTPAGYVDGVEVADVPQLCATC
jgi:uncharacterized lipoprotein YajG